MAVTSIDIVNRALEHIGSQSTITSFNDGTPEAIAANIIYTSTIQALFREVPWDFARKVIALTLSGFFAPPGWNFEYLYPSDCIEVRSIMPPAVTVFDPQPQRWAVGSSGGAVEKVIWCNLSNAVVQYTYNAPEAEWDTIFIEAAVRAVAAALAMAVAGRPDFAKEKLEEAAQFTAMGTQRDY